MLNQLEVGYHTCRGAWGLWENEFLSVLMKTLYPTYAALVCTTGWYLLHSGECYMLPVAYELTFVHLSTEIKNSTTARRYFSYSLQPLGKVEWLSEEIVKDVLGKWNRGTASPVPGMKYCLYNIGCNPPKIIIFKKWHRMYIGLQSDVLYVFFNKIAFNLFLCFH